MSRLKSRIQRYFITGLLVVVPIWGTYLVLRAMLGMLEGVLGDLFKRYGWYYFPGMGILALLLLIFVIGLLTANYFGRRVVEAWDRLLFRVPLVRTIYSAIKQVVGVVSLQQQQQFSRVVLIEFPRKGCYCLAFMTGRSGGPLQVRNGETYVNVFVPTTPNPTSGYLLLVPESQVIPLNISVEDGMKMIISGGLYTPPVLAPLSEMPREGEGTSLTPSPVLFKKGTGVPGKAHPPENVSEDRG